MTDYMALQQQSTALLLYLRDRLPESERRSRLIGKAFTRHMRRKDLIHTHSAEMVADALAKADGQ